MTQSKNLLKCIAFLILPENWKCLTLHPTFMPCLPAKLQLLCVLTQEVYRGKYSDADTDSCSNHSCLVLFRTCAKSIVPTMWFFLKMETSRPLCTHRQRYSNTYPKIQPVLKKIGARANTHFEGEEWMWRIALTCQRPIFVPIIFTVLGLSKCQNPDWRRAELIKMQKLSSESPWVITLCSQI